MQRSIDKKNNSLGFTLVETLLTLTLLLTFSIGVVALFRIGLIAGGKAKRMVQAKLLAQEGMEAIFSIRDNNGSEWDWTTTPVNTNPGEYYQPQIIGNSWVLGGKSSTNPPPVMPEPYSYFSRIVRIESVQRGVGCGSSICPIVLSGGVEDVGTRKVSVIVTWQEEGGQKEIQVDSYLTRWR